MNFEPQDGYYFLPGLLSQDLLVTEQVKILPAGFVKCINVFESLVSYRKYLTPLDFDPDLNFGKQQAYDNLRVNITWARSDLSFAIGDLSTKRIMPDAWFMAIHLNHKDQQMPLFANDYPSRPEPRGSVTFSSANIEETFRNDLEDYQNRWPGTLQMVVKQFQGRNLEREFAHYTGGIDWVGLNMQIYEQLAYFFNLMNPVIERILIKARTKDPANKLVGTYNKVVKYVEQNPQYQFLAAISNPHSDQVWGRDTSGIVPIQFTQDKLISIMRGN